MHQIYETKDSKNNNNNIMFFSELLDFQIVDKECGAVVIFMAPFQLWKVRLISLLSW